MPPPHWPFSTLDIRASSAALRRWDPGSWLCFWLYTCLQYPPLQLNSPSCAIVALQSQPPGVRTTLKWLATVTPAVLILTSFVSMRLLAAACYLCHRTGLQFFTQYYPLSTARCAEIKAFLAVRYEKREKGTSSLGLSRCLGTLMGDCRGSDIRKLGTGRR